MTSIDDEWYWLQKIAEQLETSSQTDGWSVLQNFTTSVSTIGTVALAAFAVHIAWKSHKLSIEMAGAESARHERAERDEFAKKYLSYLEILMVNWLNTPLGDTGPNGGSFAQVAVHAIALGESKDTGPKLLVSQLNRFEEDAGEWPRDSTSHEKFGGGMGTLMKNASGWARDGCDREIPLDGDWAASSS